MTLIRRFDNSYLNNLLDDFFTVGTEITKNMQPNSSPAVNVIETDDSFLLELAAPGLVKEDFTLNLNHDVLTIKAERKVDEENKEENVLRREFNYQSFERSFTLPESANKEAVDAKYLNGILTVKITKKEEEKVKPSREIQIN